MSEMGFWATLAAEHLIAAGMVERYRSSYGHSVYLGWRGREGVLRVSDHVGRSGQERGIYGRVTVRDQFPPKSPEALVDRCALMLGRYLMKTAKGGVVEFKPCRSAVNESEERP